MSQVHIVVILGLVPRIQPSAGLRAGSLISIRPRGAIGPLDPRDKPEDDTVLR